MKKFSAGDGQYVVYANNSQEAQNILRQEIKRVDEIKTKMQGLLAKDGQAAKNFEENISPENINIYFYDEESLIYKVVVIGLINLFIYLIGCFAIREKLVKSFFKRT